jgi:hypothetical protein
MGLEAGRPVLEACCNRNKDLRAEPPSSDLASRGRLLPQSERRGVPRPSHLAEHAHQFADFLTLLGAVAGGNGVFDAMGDMVLEDLFLDAL